MYIFSFFCIEYNKNQRGENSMKKERIYEIVKNKQIEEIYYHDEPVWVQEVKDDVATIGFLSHPEAKDVYITELYE